MQKHLLTCQEWAEIEFASVQLGDARRTARVVKMAAALAAKPGGTLPQAIGTWKELKAAYRLVDNTAVSFEKILTDHWQKTRALCNSPGQYLLIEDTTLLDFTGHPSLQGVGRIGNNEGRGVNLHTTLALRVEHWNENHIPQVSVVGLAGQHRWVRADELVRKPGVRDGFEAKKDRFGRRRESQRWGQVLAEFGVAQDGNERIYIADREGDIYEAFDRCTLAGFEFVIRACQDRALLGGEESLVAVVGQEVELGRYSLSLRSRPGSAARMATIALRAKRVVLRPPYRPGCKLQPRELTVLEAREVGTPSGKQQIRWLLLTSLPCETYVQALRIVQLYTCRWTIEEYHKALKTGAGIEDSQLKQLHRIEALLGILSLVSVRLLSSKMAAVVHPNQPLKSEDIEHESLMILEAHFGKPTGGWTRKNLWICIARLGGFLARRSDGDPGWQTIWRGWSQLQLMTKGAQILKGRCG